LSKDSLRGRGLMKGTARGKALLSERAFTFAHGVDPSSGNVTDVRSDIRGSNVRGAILFYPFGKGSTTASAWFLETARQGNNPAAIVTEGIDLSAVIGSVMAGVIYGKKVPVISGVPRSAYMTIKQGEEVSVDGDSGEVTRKR
jgi:phosphomecalonate degydratase small subunit